jgi:hypothetical protein
MEVKMPNIMDILSAMSNQYHGRHFDPEEDLGNDRGQRDMANAMPDYPLKDAARTYWPEDRGGGGSALMRILPILAAMSTKYGGAGTGGANYDEPFGSQSPSFRKWATTQRTGRMADQEPDRDEEDQLGAQDAMGPPAPPHDQNPAPPPAALMKLLMLLHSLGGRGGGGVSEQSRLDELMDPDHFDRPGDANLRDDLMRQGLR